jgi:hypothetical protein
MSAFKKLSEPHCAEAENLPDVYTVESDIQRRLRLPSDRFATSSATKP